VPAGLTPLYELVVATVLSSPKIFADDTSLPVLDPGRGRTKTGYLWCYAVDDRPWRGPTHPAVAYIYAEDRKNARPAEHLAHFKGVLQVDGYGGFKRLAGDRADMSIHLAFCWAELAKVPSAQPMECQRRATCGAASSSSTLRRSRRLRPRC
jgi:transposase